VAIGQVPQIALAWDTWARSNPMVHRYLSLALSGGGAVGVVIAHAPIVIMVLQHHGPNRDQYFPPPPPPEAGNGPGPEANGETPWQNGDPLASGYVAGSADRAR